MATVRVRFRSGDTDEWVVPEEANLRKLHNNLAHALRGGDIVGLGLHSRDDDLPVYAMVWLRMMEIVSFEIDGIIDHEGIERTFSGVEPEDLDIRDVDEPPHS